MGKEKLTDPNMTTMDLIMIMGEGNPAAIQILTEMMSDPRSFRDILLCDSLDIRGLKLYLLNNDCCERNQEKFKRTLMMLRCGVFTEEQIQTNLSLDKAIPFIDDDIVIEGVPVYGQNFGPTHEKWEEFCNSQKEAFTKKLDDIMKQHKNQNSEFKM